MCLSLCLCVSYYPLSSYASLSLSHSARCLHIYLPAYLYSCLYFNCVPLYITCLYLHIHALSMYPFSVLVLSIYLCMYVRMYMYIYLCMYLTICLSLHLSFLSVFRKINLYGVCVHLSEIKYEFESMLQLSECY